LPAGCQFPSGSTGGATSPAGLGDRLAAIERQRMRPAPQERRSRGVADRTTWRADAPPGHDRSGSAPATSGGLGGGEGELFTGGLTLGTFEDVDENESLPYADDDLSEMWAQKEADYARRPPLESFWDTVKRDVKYLPKDLWRDTKRVYANPMNLVILGTAYGGSLVLQQSGVDDSIENHFNEDNDFRPAHHHFKEDWRDAFGAIGNPGTHFALAGVWYLAGQQTMDDKTYEVGKTLFSALTINGLTVLLGQTATYDRGPNGELGTFPSGHTSSSFVFASVMHEAYGHLVGIPLYGLATLAGYERIEDGEHYFSDVVMGAVLGTVVGHSVASGRDPEFFGWKLLPYASTQGGTGVALVKSFGNE